MQLKLAEIVREASPRAREVENVFSEREGMKHVDEFLLREKKVILS